MVEWHISNGTMITAETFKASSTDLWSWSMATSVLKTTENA